MPKAPSSRGASTLFFVVVIIVFAGIAGLFAFLYFRQVTPIQQEQQEAAKFINSFTGSAKALPKTLDPRFTDADGDLVADAPKDPVKLIDPPVLFFSYVTENPEETKAVWKDFTDHLAKVTGKKVEYVAAPTAHDQVRALMNGQMHIAGLNTGAVPMAVNLAGFVPAFTLGTPDAGGYLHSDIIVPADSPIQKPEDLKGHTLALVDPNSNSGYKAPLVYMREKFNMLPETDYLTVFSFGHDRSIAGIASHSYEAAAVASDMLERAIGAKKIDKSQYRVIYSSDRFPAVCMGYEYNLAPDLVARIREAFTTFNFTNTSLGREFAPAKQDHFQPVDYKKDFTTVRYIDDQLGRPYDLQQPQ
jgi:phosphonate transport system substrate-binding protein